jgi:hypothetical protein
MLCLFTAPCRHCGPFSDTIIVEVVRNVFSADRGPAPTSWATCMWAPALLVRRWNGWAPPCIPCVLGLPTGCLSTPSSWLLKFSYGWPQCHVQRWWIWVAFLTGPKNIFFRVDFEGLWRSPLGRRQTNIPPSWTWRRYRQRTPRCCIISGHGSISSYTVGRWRSCSSKQMASSVRNRMSQREWGTRSQVKTLVWFWWIDETLATNLCALSVCEIGW